MIVFVVLALLDETPTDLVEDEVIMVVDSRSRESAADVFVIVAEDVAVEYIAVKDEEVAGEGVEEALEVDAGVVKEVVDEDVVDEAVDEDVAADE